MLLIQAQTSRQFDFADSVKILLLQEPGLTQGIFRFSII